MIDPIPVTPPKTGSITFWQTALKYSGIENLPTHRKNIVISKAQSEKISELDSDYGNPNFHCPANYFRTFSDNIGLFTRDPYSRELSMIAHISCSKIGKEFNKEIAEYIKARAEFKIICLYKIFRWNASDFAYNSDTDQLIKNIQIVKFENYASDIHRIWGFNVEDTVFNKTGSFVNINDYAPYYNDQRVQFVNKQYQKDFDFFGYRQYSCYEEMLAYTNY